MPDSVEATEGQCLTSKEPAPRNTPDLGEPFCPACEPGRSVLDARGDGRVWFEKLCGNHDALPAGDADEEAKAHGLGDAFLTSAGMAEGDVSNRAACDIVHRSGG